MAVVGRVQQGLRQLHPPGPVVAADRVHPGGQGRPVAHAGRGGEHQHRPPRADHRQRRPQQPLARRSGTTHTPARLIPRRAVNRMKSAAWASSATWPPWDRISRRAGTTSAAVAGRQGAWAGGRG